MFGTKIRIKSGMLNCTYILKIVPSPPQGPQTTIQLEYSPKFLAQHQDRIKKMLKCTHILEFVHPPLRAQRQQSNSITPPIVWHTNQDKIKNVELFTHSSNCVFGPKTTIKLDNSPKCFAQISGYNQEC